ncbi:hypothetical protein RZS08_14495, partial [Arthrospira platensis SPKY1]|nr:hypothetical protein [Arthrospira platensis SPKY1]
PNNATLLINLENSNQFEARKSGYYWILANHKLSKSSDFYGKNIPVAVQNYLRTLPITDPILVK